MRSSSLSKRRRDETRLTSRYESCDFAEQPQSLSICTQSWEHDQSIQIQTMYCQTVCRMDTTEARKCKGAITEPRVSPELAELFCFSCRSFLTSLSQHRFYIIALVFSLRSIDEARPAPD